MQVSESKSNNQIDKMKAAFVHYVAIHYRLIKSANPLGLDFFIGDTIITSLTSEIGLKTLLRIENTNYGRIHDLESLFNKLEKSTQNKILALFSMSEESFSKALHGNKDSFIKWRYHFEPTPDASYSFLDEFQKAIGYVLIGEEAYNEIKKYILNK